MIIGCPKEIKVREYRVGLVPGGVQTLVSRGHTVLLEKGAGVGSGIGDESYARAGAQIVREPFHPVDDPEGWLAFLADLDGNYFQIASPAPDM